MRKKIIGIILNIVALIPIITTVVSLILAIILFLSSVLSSILSESIFHFESRSLAVIILLILLSLYGIRLKRLQIKQEFQCLYCLTQLILAIGIIIFNSRIPIIFNLIVGIIFALIFEPKLQNVRTYFQRSRNALVAFNLFDLCFIISCFVLVNIDYDNVHELNGFINQFEVSGKDLELISVVLFSIILFILIPFLRGCLSVLCYKKQNGIHNKFGKVFCFSHIKAYLVSIVSISVYLSAFFENDSSNFSSILLLYLILMSFTVFFWTMVYEGIDRGGEDKENALTNVALIVLLSIFLILLDQIESDLIGILTWFLPILLPVFIGEINNITSETDSRSQTPAMKKHIYLMQMMSFNTLLVFNVISSISTKQIIKSNEIYQTNILKDFLTSLAESLKYPVFIIKIIISIVLLFISMIIAYGLSKLMIYLIKRNYMDTSRKFFD